MKIHCAELVEQALRATLDPSARNAAEPVPAASPAAAPAATGNLLDNFMPATSPAQPRRVVLLKRDA
jgi:hypothetical protein